MPEGGGRSRETLSAPAVPHAHSGASAGGVTPAARREGRAGPSPRAAVLSFACGSARLPWGFALDAFRRLLPRLLLLAVALSLLLMGAGSVALFETSEARYAEVAREMVATGDYLSPQIDYVYHFTKPPLAYWITAAGYHLFGPTPFGARFFLALAAVGVLALTAALYKRVRPGRDGAVAASVLAASTLFFAFGRVLTTDMFLTLWITAGFLLWAALESGRLTPRAFSIAFGAVAGLAFLTKGPVALLLWACALLPYALWKDRGRCLKPLANPACWGVFLLVAVPWFVAVGLKHPGLLQYLAFRESSEAAYSAQRYHPGPFYYYGPILLGGLLPWWVLLAGRWRAALKPEVRLWLLWAVVPVLVWSFFPAKLPAYVLPVLPAWALLTARAMEEEEGPPRWAWVLAGVLAGGVPAAALGALALGRLKVPPLSTVPLALLGLAALCGAAAAVAGALGHKRFALAGLLGVALSFQAAVPSLCLDLEDQIRGRQRLGRTLAQERLPGEAVLEYRTTVYSVPFYLGDKVAAYESSFIRKKYVESVPDHLLQGPGALAAYAKSHPGLWVVSNERAEVEMARELPGLALVLRQGDHSLWVSPPVAARLGLAPAGP